MKIPVSQLELLEKNPRRISRAQMQKLCESLEEDPSFMEKRPVLVNRKDGKKIVYAGNQRVRAAKKLGWKEINCDIDDDLDEKTMRSRILKDNKTFGEFDYEMLANEWDVDELIKGGFTPEELSFESSIEKEEAESEKCPTCGKKMKK